jgi:transketolase
VLIATGSEVELAVSVATAGRQGIGADVVPCLLVAVRARRGYRATAPGRSGLDRGPRDARLERYVGADGLAIASTGFGASAPAEDLFKSFGFTPDAIVRGSIAALNSQERQ